MNFNYQSGSQFGEYVLDRPLGRGGFGDVWLAHSTTGQPVALKMLTGHFFTADAAKLRAEVELLAASASAGSKHIVSVLGGGLEPMPHVIMEYVDGTDLASEIGRTGTLPVTQVLRVARAVFEALGVLESAGIIHRDVKPANVMIDRTGLVKLTDFGIAKIVGFDTITATSQAPLSMAYAAPEVWEGKASHSSDLYAAGSMLFQCLSGRPAFIGSPTEVFRHHLMTEPDASLLPTETPAALRDLILQCMQKEPDKRPQGAAAALLLVEQAEAEMTSRQQAQTQQPSTHEPLSFGPWRRDYEHPTLPWAFICTNQSTGEHATVEVLSSNDLGLGDSLRTVLRVNAKLVPLGAERLIASNRLILRPHEAWPAPPAERFQFWVARQELTPGTAPTVVSAQEQREIAGTLDKLIAEASAEGVYLNLRPENLSLQPGGRIALLRPGLPPFTPTDPRADADDFLASLPLDDQATVVGMRLPRAPLEPERDDMATAIFRTAPRQQLETEPAPAPPTLTPPPRVETPWPPSTYPLPPPVERRSSRTPILVGAAIGLVIAIAGAVAVTTRGGGGNKAAPPASDRRAAATPAPAATAVPDVTQFLSAGTRAMNDKRYDAAVAEFTKAIDKLPTSSGAHLNRGEAYRALGKNDLAYADFTKALQLDPKFSTAYYQRAELSRSLGQRDPAWVDYTKVIELEPSNFNAYFYRGLVSLNFKAYDGAVADFSKAIELSPRSANAFVNRGTAYKGLAKIDQAFADYAKAIEIDPRSAVAYEFRAGLNYEIKRYDEAISDFSKAIELDPKRSSAYNDRGLTYSAQNKPDLAIADYSKAIEINPRAYISYTNRGIIHNNARRYAEALADYAKAIEINPNYYSAYLNRGNTYRNQNRNDLARADYEKAKSLATTPAETQRAQAAIDALPR